MNQIEKKSPSGSKSLILTYRGEIRFGPFLFSLETKGFELNKKFDLITDEFCWSKDDRCLALVEVKYDAATNKHTSFLWRVDISTGSMNLIASKAGRICPKKIDYLGGVEY